MKEEGFFKHRHREDADTFNPHYEDDSYEAKLRRIGHYGITTGGKDWT